MGRHAKSVPASADHTSTPDSELLDEAKSRLDVAEKLLAKTGAVSLAAARSEAVRAATALSNVAEQADHRCVHLHRRWDRLTDAWETACRSPQVRSELLTQLAPQAAGSAESTMWWSYGVEITPLGGVALRAFAASPRWPQRWGSRTGRATCLWGPHWLLPELHARGHITPSMAASLPATQSEAEVAANLWEPYQEHSVFWDIHAALDTARALLH